jgi:lipoprotein-anchoring transpeptidase ErfK/SrfK
MIMDGGIADTGEMDEAARLGLGSGLLNRRSFLIGSAVSLGALGLAGCATSGGMSRAEAARLYGPMPDEKFPIPAVDLGKLDPKYYRRTVRYDSNEAPGTIIVDPGKYYVYRIEGDGNATRYGANVGRDGFRWSGDAYVGRKSEWAVWTPPKEMIQRQPELRRHLSELQSGVGMSGGPRNPLGARALYLWQGNKDTLFRIHGTVEPWTIGSSVSSGCIRMINQDVIDLYQRTAAGAKVVVLPARS